MRVWRLRKMRIAAAVMLLALMIALVVAVASPYRPMVERPVEIEDIWVLEDTRQESEKPLVTALENNGVPLAYDAQENTFYCTLGMENGEEWPQLHLTASGAKSVSVCFVDDYTYDYCSDAIREGYSYGLFAYTEAEYSYFNIVFTGLPQVCLYTQEQIDRQDVPITVYVGMEGEEALTTSARVHARGHWSYKNTDKKSYEIEFTRRTNGTGKIARMVPGMGETDKILLLAMAGDEMMMRDRLSWAMAEKVWPQTEGFAPRRTQYTEVFLNDAYCGVYLMMLPYDYEQELAKAGNSATDTNRVYRVVPHAYERPYIEDESVVLADRGSLGYELRYTNGDSAFEPFQAYLKMMRATCGEDEFTALVRTHMDMDSMLRYALLMQGMVLMDNSRSNMYIWIKHDKAGDRYCYALWDMDMSWDYDAGAESDYWICNPMIDRVLSLDVDGARSRLASMWEKMKDAGFTYEGVEKMVSGYARELQDSGAFARDAQRWQKAVSAPDVSRILNTVDQRFMVMDGVIDYIAKAKGAIAFLDVGKREERLVVSLFEEIENLFEE